MKNGGPAFPHTLDMVSGGNTRGGMSLRQWYAGMALPALIEAYQEANYPAIGTDHILRNVPALAFKFADAMIAEGEK